jgi:hypothetical protein
VRQKRACTRSPWGKGERGGGAREKERAIHKLSQERRERTKSAKKGGKRNPNKHHENIGLAYVYVIAVGKIGGED